MLLCSSMTTAAWRDATPPRRTRCAPRSSAGERAHLRPAASRAAGSTTRATASAQRDEAAASSEALAHSVSPLLALVAVTDWEAGTGARAPNAAIGLQLAWSTCSKRLCATLQRSSARGAPSCAPASMRAATPAGTAAPSIRSRLNIKPTRGARAISPQHSSVAQRDTRACRGSSSACMSAVTCSKTTHSSISSESGA